MTDSSSTETGTSEMTPEVLAAFSEGPIIAGSRGAGTWSFTGPGPDGTVMETRGCDIFEFRGGKIARKDAFRKVYEAEPPR